MLKFDDFLSPSLFSGITPLKKCSIPALVGNFFERIAFSILPSPLVKNMKENQPDFTSKNCSYEIKASKSKFMLSGDQLEAFIDLQNSAFISIYYVMFFYNIPGCLQTGSTENLFRSLLSNIEGCFIFSAEDIYKVVQPLTRYEHKGWIDKSGFYYRIPDYYLYHDLRRIKSVSLSFGPDLQTNKFTIYRKASIREDILK